MASARLAQVTPADYQETGRTTGNIYAGQRPFKKCKNGHLRTPENVSKSRACRKCRNVLSAAWHKANPGYWVAWRKAHPDYYKEYFRAYRLLSDKRIEWEIDRNAKRRKNSVRSS